MHEVVVVVEGLVATTWELSQPQGPSQMVVAGANASRKIEFKLEEVPLNSFSGMCLISNSLKMTLTQQSFVEVTVYKGHFMIHSKRGSKGQNRGELDKRKAVGYQEATPEGLVKCAQDKIISKYHAMIDNVKYLRLRQMRSREDKIMEGRAEHTWGSPGSNGTITS